MKKLIIALLIVISFASCSIKNTYRISGINQNGRMYTTLIQTTKNWDVSQSVEINGQSFVVMGVQDFEIVSK